mmetsp:Transcript_10428/g.63745  ORF Transcript_10428/g.63745 Transcript_10428/m.63745 type:complete len:237 (+) Transcript_10428:2344-3054(+)
MIKPFLQSNAGPSRFKTGREQAMTIPLTIMTKQYIMNRYPQSLPTMLPWAASTTMMPANVKMIVLAKNSRVCQKCSMASLAWPVMEVQDMNPSKTPPAITASSPLACKSISAAKKASHATHTEREIWTVVLYTFKNGEIITSPAARAIASPMAGPPKADLKMFSTTSPPVKVFPVSMSRNRKNTTDETPSHRWLSPIIIMESFSSAFTLLKRATTPTGSMPARIAPKAMESCQDQL